MKSNDNKYIWWATVCSLIILNSEPNSIVIQSIKSPNTILSYECLKHCDHLHIAVRKLVFPRVMWSCKTTLLSFDNFFDTWNRLLKDRVFELLFIVLGKSYNTSLTYSTMSTVKVTSVWNSIFISTYLCFFPIVISELS